MRKGDKTAYKHLNFLNTIPLIFLQTSITALAAAGHAELAELVVSRPAAVAAGLTRVLAAKEALPQGVRVWLRPELPWKDPISLHQALRLATAEPSTLRCLSGVVAAVSAEEEALVEATYVCEACGTESRELGEEAAAPVCSCGVMGADPARSVTVPVSCFGRFCTAHVLTSPSMIVLRYLDAIC